MISFHDPRFLRFLAVGALNTVFGYSVFAALILLGIHYAVAAFVSTVAGVLFNFKTTGSFVFANRENRLLFRFVAVYALTYVVGVGLLRWSEGYGIPVLLAAAVFTLPMAAFSFTLQRIFVFREG